jgi:hypothetical protein
MTEETTYTAFDGVKRVAAGGLAEVLVGVKRHLGRSAGRAALVFEDQTGKQVDFDLRGTDEEVIARAAPAAAPREGPGRPRLGVVSREVSLLPRHWAWLEAQPQGISAALRRLVDEDRKREPEARRAARARDAAGRFMWAVAGNLAGFVEASRALYAGDLGRLRRLTRGWPRDVRDHVLRLVGAGAKRAKRSSPPSTAGATRQSRG